MSDEKYYNVNVICSFGIGGRGEHSSRVDFETVQLMLQSPFITVNGTTIKVKTFEVTDLGTINFYGEEIKYSKERGLTLEEIKKYL